ncbi:MAG: hypothetical protein VW891_03610, partial [Novosphingobium sp.]
MRLYKDRPAISTSGLIVFSAGHDADMLVAGIPAAARVVREARLAGLLACEVNGGEGWQPAAMTRAEVQRLGGTMPVTFSPPPLGRQGLYAVIRGDALPAAQAIADAVAGSNETVDGVQIASGAGIEDAIARALSEGREGAARLASA